jgi:hypothetical protein
MDEKTIRMINNKIDEFFKSDLGKNLAKEQNSLGKKVRQYRKAHEHHELTELRAVSLLLDVNLVEDIVIKKYK